MRKTITLSILCLLVIAGSAMASDEHKHEHKGEHPMMSMIIREQIDPGAWEAYKEGTMKWIELMKAEGMQLMFYSFNDNEGGQNYVVPVAKMSDIDGLAMSWGKAVAKLRETDWGKARQAAVMSTKYTMWMSSMYMSYMPENMDPNKVQMKYMKWLNVRVTNSNEKAFVGAMMEIVKVYQKHKVDRPFYVYRNIIGEEGPMYTIVFPGDDPADYFTWSKAWKGKLEDDMKEARTNVMSLCEEIVTGEGWSSPKLSLLPEMKH